MRISRKKRPDKPLLPQYRVNESIVAPQVRLLGEDGGNLGVLSIREAKDKAYTLQLDLVEINPKAEPPVCKLIDYRRFKYQKEKELKKQKIGAHESEVKGIRLSIRISEHDLDVKRQQAEKFLERGDRAKVEIILRGRENAKAGLAFDTLNKFFTLISQNQSVRYETEPARQANRISAIITRK
ncbi:MAG TPA: translation initiation factor IF-3 [Patescibacteria group bacterium]|nr:translation initiation factor IF-3 [Patescibacteria group bacterium]